MTRINTPSNMELTIGHLLCILCLFVSTTNGQEVVPDLLKCREGWTLLLDSCYVYVPYQRSWQEALNYCQNYGARLAEPSGYVLNREIAQLVPENTNYWTGFTTEKQGQAAPQAYKGWWSDGRETEVKVGTWAPGGQPVADSSNNCAYVDTSSKQSLWQMKSCLEPLPSVCEATPCPTDTFMCYNGNCRSNANNVLCDGNNDCGDNSDEMDCESKCSFSYYGNGGTINLETNNGVYGNKLSCWWHLESPVGTRIRINITNFHTEKDNDFAEIWNGGPANRKPVVKLSGSLDNAEDNVKKYQYFVSSVNFLLFHFCSDIKDAFGGFRIEWTTEELDCAGRYREFRGRGFTAASVFHSSQTILTKQTYVDCLSDCNDDARCTAVAHRPQSMMCYFFHNLPVIEDNPAFNVHVKTCQPNTLLSGQVSLPSNQLTATDVLQDLVTPGFPGEYPGDLEFFSVITSPRKPIYIKVASCDLCCDDYIDILDGGGPDSASLYRLTGTDRPLGLLSSGHQVYVRMSLKHHWSCPGASLQYRYGCDLDLTESYGTIQSPGAVSYPGLLSCTWTLHAAMANNGVRVTFNTFDLEDGRDFVTVAHSGGINMGEPGTGSSYLDRTFTADDFLTITMTSDALGQNQGFSATFTGDCYTVRSASTFMRGTNVEDLFTIECNSGYAFTGMYEGEETVPLRCVHGVWDLSPLPECSQSICSAPPTVENAIIAESTGQLGGHETRFQCNNGFTMSGNPEIECQSDGTWTESPQCTSVPCEELESILSPDVIVNYVTSDSTNLKHGSVAMVTCPENWEIHGPSVLQCLNGAWDYGSEEPTCQKTRCQEPVIPNAVLYPDTFYLGESIRANCNPGFVLEGEKDFRCGTSDPMPTCRVKKCKTDVFVDQNLIIDLTAEYSYGDVVSVLCTNGFELLGSDVTTMDIVCTDSATEDGQWSAVPTCVQKSCNVPPLVTGAAYESQPNYPCFDCEFTFTCRSRYELTGKSSQNDNVVRCGPEGIWDFGELNCKGGQCDNPGSPVGAEIQFGSEFTEGQSVTYSCSDGFAPSTPVITCGYNAQTDRMEWDHDVADIVCMDDTGPTIRNCPEESPTERLPATPRENYIAPYAEDPSGVCEFVVTPLNIDPFQPLASAVVINVRATDCAGQSSSCSITVTIPEKLTCLNQHTHIGIRYLPTTVNLPLYVHSSLTYTITEDRNEGEGEVESFTVNSAEDVLATPVYTVRGYEDGGVVAECKVLLSFEAQGCDPILLFVENAVVTPVASSDTASIDCDQGFYFFEDANQETVSRSCVNREWDAEPPVCAAAAPQAAGALRSEANIRYGYTLDSAVSAGDSEACASYYGGVIDNRKADLSAVFSATCGVDVTYDSQSLGYLTGNLDAITVSGIIFIDSVDETLVSTCLQALENVFTPQRFPDIPAQDNCPMATYSPVATQVDLNSWYGCYGDRKYQQLADGSNLCLECPVGTSLVTSDGQLTCKSCEAGTYGVMDDTKMGGAKCVACPSGTSRKTGMKRVEECTAIPGRCPPGNFSSSGLEPCRPCPENYYQTGQSSSTCQECGDNQITEFTGSIEQSECFDGFNTLCANNPCENGGTCSVVRHSVYCSCPADYTGSRCETQITACISNPCQHNTVCVPKEQNWQNDYDCGCPLEMSTESLFYGKNCQFLTARCPEDDSLFCKNNGTCHGKQSGYECKCPTNSGYKGGSCLDPRDPCTENPCHSDNTKVCRPYGLDQQTYRQCICKPGYTGLDCETVIDTCQRSPCQNGGTCERAIDDFSCTCPPGYTGKHCELEAACGFPCSNERKACELCHDANTRTCENVGNSYSCTCQDGFNGTLCTAPTLECASHPCQHGGTCVDLENGSHQCNCVPPWTGSSCETMEDHCVSASTGTQVCQAGASSDPLCYSSTTTFRCICPADRVGDNCETVYDLCVRTTPCQGEGSTCSVTSEGTTECNCGPGLTGDLCEKTIPVCGTDSCQNGGTCSVVNEAIKCQCVAGYQGDLCETNTDDCLQNTCAGNEVCVDGVNGFTCRCVDGKRGVNCDKDLIGSSDNFDYVIEPAVTCLQDPSIVSFGDGIKELTELSVALWFRYTKYNEPGTFLWLFGTNEISGRVPDNPTWELTANSQSVSVVFNSGSGRRRKRNTGPVNVQYPNGVTVTDGYWHTFIFTWKSSTGEATVYIDGNSRQRAFASGLVLPASGFILLGDLDPATSFEGRISRLLILDYELQEPSDTAAYQARFFAPDQEHVVLLEEKATMTKYSVDYVSELDNPPRCLSASDNNCPAFYDGSSFPAVVTCPGDTTVDGTDRVSSPEWPSPSFSGIEAATVKTTSQSAGTPMTWGVGAVAFAGYDAAGNAAVCTFRLFKNRFSCARPTAPEGGSQNCQGSEGSDMRCQLSCPGNSVAPTGDSFQYYTCSPYSGWDQTDSELQYIYPACASTQSLEYSVTMTLLLTLPEGGCALDSTLVESFYQKMLSDVRLINTAWSAGVCLPTCDGIVPSSVMSCNGDSLQVAITFDRIEATLTSTNDRQTTETLENILMTEIGENQAFYFSTADQTVTPEFSTLRFDIVPTCPDQYQVVNGQCVLCGSGTEYDAQTKTCVRCAVGSYRDFPSDATCVSCNSATTETEGSTAVSYCHSACFTGRFYDGSACAVCPAGFYQGEVGQSFCHGCPVGETTAQDSSTSSTDCVPESSVTTTAAPSGGGGEAGASIGASTGGDSGLETGVIVAVVLGCVLGISIILLLLLFCCCKEQVPCIGDRGQKVVPVEKEKYYVSRYGETNMHFVSYRLQDVREKKGRSLDRQPIVEPPLSDESGSVKTDISVHVPVFMEKLDGNVKNQHTYMNTRAPSRQRTLTPRTPRTPHSDYEDMEEDQYVPPKRKEKRRHRRPPAELPEPMPKALAPLPNRMRSMPPSELNIRPLSALNKPRKQVLPAQYEEFLHPSPPTQRRPVHDEDEYYEDMERYSPDPTPPRRRVDAPQYYTSHTGREDLQMRKIEVDSDSDDLR